MPYSQARFIRGVDRAAQDPAGLAAHLLERADAVAEQLLGELCGKTTIE